MDFTHSVVYVTCSDKASAEKIAKALVEERLAACANIIEGVTSVFRWEGQIDTDPELLLVIKTRTDRLDVLTERVKALHSYDVPEVIALPIIGGSQDYLEWINQSVE